MLSPVILIDSIRSAVRAWVQALSNLKRRTLSILFWEIPKAKYDRWGLYPQAFIVVGFWGLNELRLPFTGHAISTGYAIAALAFAAVVMAARESLTSAEKIMWIVICAVLFVWELRVIDRDHADQEHQHHVELQEQQDRFTATMKQFSRTEELAEHTLTETNQASTEAKRAVDNITGGNTYVSVSPILLPLDGSNTFPMIAGIGKNCEKRALQNITISLAELPDPNFGTAQYLRDVLNGKGKPPAFTGTILSTSGALLSERIAPKSTGESDYIINVIAANMDTVENLKVRKNEKTSRWEFSYVISRVIPNKPGIIADSKTKLLEKTIPAWQEWSVISNGRKARQ